ncbi:hypothetical protein ACSOQX_000617 [Yersinia enterocolitica]
MTDTKERATARKRLQRQKERENGSYKLIATIDQQEKEMLQQNCALRRPQREPYDMDEYITMLIRKDNAELQAQLKEQAGRSSKSKLGASAVNVAMPYLVIVRAVHL